MAFREVRDYPKQVPRRDSRPSGFVSISEDPVEPATPAATGGAAKKSFDFKFSLPSLPSLPTGTIPIRYALYLGARICISLFLVWLGLTLTGSFFGPASGRFSGELAKLFYQYQLGTLIAMAGAIIGYDTITYCW